ncbi:MAG: 2-oxo acid dehydrogenase subunit E2 [Chloroflexi bacterium]|nr:2-oxo acid dehydrogenase subunit E2 [Chloroflexota bacterium]
MATPVIMPKTGMTQETGTVIRWFYQEGDYVKKGEPLLEVMTDKVNMEIEAPASGVLKGIKAFPNDIVPVTQVIAYIVEPGEELVEEKVTPTPAMGEGVPVERREPTPVATTAAIAPETGKVKATPVARRLAREHGLDLTQITGQGPGGTITKDDVLKAMERAAAPPTAPPVREAKTIPLVGRRRIIAERMQQSVREAPHIALSIEVDMSAAEKARHDASYTALLVHVVARVLRKHPLLNSTLRGDQIVLLDDINIGVAVATDEGLIVPVIKRADTKLLADIDTELKELTKRARAGKLTLDDVTGGTFTITNLGMFDIPYFRAVINPPEAAILAVGAIIKRPVVIDDGIYIRPIMTLTVSADHRILDGVAVAKFLQELKAALERLA